jgi:hypothetical protein
MKRLRCLNWLRYRTSTQAVVFAVSGCPSQVAQLAQVRNRLSTAKNAPVRHVPFLRAEVVRSGQQKAILLEHLADGIGSKVEWLDVVHRLECDLRQQVDEVVILVADHRHTGRVLTRVAHIVVDDCLSTGEVLQSETILLANSSRLT